MLQEMFIIEIERVHFGDNSNYEDKIYLRQKVFGDIYYIYIICAILVTI